jgi:hypothetical protein
MFVVKRALLPSVRSCCILVHFNYGAHMCTRLAALPKTLWMTARSSDKNARSFLFADTSDDLAQPWKIARRAVVGPVDYAHNEVR